MQQICGRTNEQVLDRAQSSDDSGDEFHGADNGRAECAGCVVGPGSASLPNRPVTLGGRTAGSSGC